MPPIRLADEDSDEDLLTVENSHDLSFAESGSEPPSGKRESRYSGCEASHNGCAEVAGGQAPRLFVQVLERFIVEGRIRRKASHDSGRERQAKSRRDPMGGQRDVHDRAEQKRADQIDRERAIGKGRSQRRQEPARQEGTPTRSEPAAQTDPKKPM